jgi:hypothetical protein
VLQWSIGDGLWGESMLQIITPRKEKGRKKREKNICREVISVIAIKR